MTGQVPTIDVPAELLELKTALENDWPAMSYALHASGALLNEGEGGAGGGDSSATGGGGATTATGGAGATEKPPWGDDEFDADRAWKLLEDTRSDRAKLKAERDELKKTVKTHEDASKSETDKATERATTAEKTAAEATHELARLRVAVAKGLTPAQAKRLSGSTEEELTADADELLELFKQDGESGGQGPARRPKEKLRSGAATVSDDDDETDPRKLAAMVPKPYS